MRVAPQCSAETDNNLTTTQAKPLIRATRTMIVGVSRTWAGMKAIVILIALNGVLTVASSSTTLDRFHGILSTFYDVPINDGNEPVAEDTSDHGPALIAWLRRSKGSFFHPDLEIRKRDPTSTSSSPHYGIYAKDNIPANELLIEIPRSLMIQPGPPQVGERAVGYFANDENPDGGAVPYFGVITSKNKDGTYDLLVDGDDDEQTGLPADSISHEGFPINCATVRLLSHHLKLGEASTFAPYVRYLQSLPTKHLPTSWSEAGQARLLEVMGHNMEEYGGEPMLPPRSAFGWLEQDWLGRCGGADDPVEHLAYMLVMQRSWDDTLIPVYDIMSHRNGRWWNTNSDPIREGKSVRIRASRQIKAGEELYTSYNFCSDCGDRSINYGTPELLRDYGFVEQYPRRFVFHDQNMAFDIDIVYTSGGSPTKQTSLNWTNAYPVPDEEALHFLVQQVQRLKDLNATDFTIRSPDVPEVEWEVTTQYLEALVAAMESAIARAQSEGTEATKCSDDDETCNVASDRYPTLEDLEEDWSVVFHTCDAATAFSYDEWLPIEKIATSYQLLEFETNPTMNNDMCMSVDDVVKSCLSYRPHYHEMVVHFAAAYMSDIKRVIFIGGGDAMLLHEILKYPSLELVVGLELDQSVVRNSFKFFGTQPHWDKDIVQWWFGDVSTTLRLLPKHYFGTFDLVFVDLSAEDASGSITANSDLREAITMLPNPKNGILVQNAMPHFQSAQELFRYSAHLHYYGVPVICSQSLVVASNGVNLLRDPFHLHDVKTLYPLLQDTNVRYKIMRDFQETKNPVLCDVSRLASVVEKHVSSANNKRQGGGVLMTIEVENVSTLIDSLAEVNDLVAQAAVQLGLNVVSTTSSHLAGGDSSAVVLREGYIAIRCWSREKQYLAVDIHLWSKLEKHDLLKSSLLQALGVPLNGTTSSSSFRILAGGIADSKPLESTQSALNLQNVDSICSTSAAQVERKIGVTLGVAEFLNIATAESLELVDESSYVVAVLCGPRGTKCKSVNQVKMNKRVQHVLPLWTCSSIEGGVEFAPDGPDRLFACEKELLKYLQDSVDGFKIRAIVLDHASSYSMAQVVIRTFQNALHSKKFLSENIFVLAAVLHPSETWRKVFVDTFRDDIFDDEPVFGSVLQFQATPFPCEISVTASGNHQFLRNLTEFLAATEQRTGVPGTIESVRAGAFLWVEDFNAVGGTYSNQDYDLSDALLQWSSQRPLGLQTVARFELAEVLAKAPSQLLAALHQALSLVGIAVEPETHLYQQNVGVGCFLEAFWSSGSAILLWDGTTHVTANLFTRDQDQDDRWATILLGYLQYQLPSLRLASVDSFPRGLNRAILHPSPLPHERPMWAPVLAKGVGP